MKGVLLRILGDFAATIAFIIVYYATHNIVFATAFAIALGLAQIAYLFATKQTITAMQWMSLGLVVVLGGATMITANSTFIRLKASIAHFAIAAIMLKRRWLLPYLPPIVTGNVAEGVLIAWGYIWCAVMAAMGAANIAASLAMTMDQWTIFISGLGVAKLVLLGAQFWDIRARVAKALRAKLPAQP